MKKVVIFYSKTAGGHLRSAEAIAESLQQKDVEIVMLDALEKTNLGVKINPAHAYGVLSAPLLPVFNLLYSLTNNRLGVKALRLLIKLTWGRQFRKLIEYEQPDLIITTHHFISPATINALKKDYPFVTVVTDLGKPHRIWFDQKADKIITPTPGLAKLTKLLLNSTDEQIVHLGYPLKSEFKSETPQQFSNTILIIGGGLGAGRIDQQLKLLQSKLPDHKFLVVCGFNKKLFNQLSVLKNKRIRLFQFVDNIDQLMSQSDMVITKAGPGTIIEAAQMRKPMIITDWIGLQEKENIKFVQDNKLGIFCPELEKLPDAVAQIYQNYSDYLSSKNWSGLKQITAYLNKLLA